MVDILAVVQWALSSTDDFRSRLLKVMNLGDDSDTAESMYGLFAGTVYGFASISSE
ncbi:ADP-ribosylglycohydrolase family protein [Marinobacter orientalis]|uniref:ADP-ribosylglycohydrolase n=1 Tax=Marinobacter orientalis TaxID=1928859 RepID=A0A7Y0NIR4_9GAMM|nr:hypothetical protein [Marinobacter orientalis]TGX50902.1 hypothetical protein DIT72_02360 [Marinobacter orientalis]